MVARISCSVCAIQNLLVLLNSSWITACVMTFYIQYESQIKSCYTLNSHNQVKFYMYIDKSGFPSPHHICINQPTASISQLQHNNYYVHFNIYLHTQSIQLDYSSDLILSANSAIAAVPLLSIMSSMLVKLLV